MQIMCSSHRPGWHADIHESACHCSSHCSRSDLPPLAFISIMSRNVLSHLCLNSWRGQGQLDTGWASVQDRAEGSRRALLHPLVTISMGQRVVLAAQRS